MKPYRIVMRAVITDEQDRILLMQRSSKCLSFPGYWELPGGKINDGEHFIDALVREIAEETGLAVRPCRFMGSSHYESDKNHTIYLIFEVSVEKGVFQRSDEHDQHAWVERNKLARYQIPPQLQHIIKQLITLQTA